jgi:hypothetical protein
VLEKGSIRKGVCKGAIRQVITRAAIAELLCSITSARANYRALPPKTGTLQCSGLVSYRYNPCPSSNGLWVLQLPWSISFSSSRHQHMVAGRSAVCDYPIPPSDILCRTLGESCDSIVREGDLGARRTWGAKVESRLEYEFNFDFGPC